MEQHRVLLTKIKKSHKILNLPHTNRACAACSYMNMHNASS